MKDAEWGAVVWTNGKWGSTTLHAFNSRSVIDGMKARKHEFNLRLKKATRKEAVIQFHYIISLRVAEASEMKVKWIHADWREGAINFSQFTFIQWNEWINWRNVTRLVTGPFTLQLNSITQFTALMWIEVMLSGSEGRISGFIQSLISSILLIELNVN